MPTYVIGDPHGCSEELRELLRLVGFQRGTDRVVLAGDLIDRGPDPLGVVRLARESGAEAVLGNHDERMLRWFRREAVEKSTGTKNRMIPPVASRLAQWNTLGEDDRAWLEALPLTMEVAPGWLCVHGGFEAIPMGEQKPEKVLRCRYLDPVSGRMVAFKGASVEQPEGTVYWTSKWIGPDNVVYGHAVHSLKSPRVDRPVPGVECWGIDTGCCFGGRLTALCIETREIVQVDAREKYADLKREIIE
jgi:diadenosine tetraphosphatase ApaH/serine/threonine PP2A family protein phosphatase